ERTDDLVPPLREHDQRGADPAVWRQQRQRGHPCQEGDRGVRSLGDRRRAVQGSAGRGGVPGRVRRLTPPRSGRAYRSLGAIKVPRLLPGWGRKVDVGSMARGCCATWEGRMLTERTFDTGEVTINYVESSVTGPLMIMLHGMTATW